MQVCGNGTDPAWVAAAADLLGGTVCECPGGTRPDAAGGAEVLVVLLGGATDAMLRRTIARGGTICYALDEDFDIAALRRPHAVLGEPGLIAGVCLSARAAYRLPVGSIIADAVTDLAGIGEATRLNLDIALSEAIANSLLHGCLELDSPKERFDPAFIAAIDRRIADPVYASRPVWVGIYRDDDRPMLRVLVADEGSGFRPPAAPDLSAPETASRGIGLIHAAATSATYKDQGRCLEMKFSL